MREFLITAKNLAQTIPSLIRYLSSEGFYASPESMRYAGYFAWIEAQSNKLNLSVTEAALYAPISHQNLKSRLDIRSKKGNLSVFLKPTKGEITAKIFYDGENETLSSELEEHIKKFYEEIQSQRKKSARSFWDACQNYLFHQFL